jgi:hypothetical protein
MAVEPSEPSDGFGADFIKGAAFTEPSARERSRKPGPLRRARDRRSERRAEKRRRRAMVGQWRDPRYRAKGLAKTATSALTGALIVAVITAVVWDARGDAPWRRMEPAVGAEVPQISANDPFGGSPAEDYADGEAGIEFPAPKAMNGLSADDLALAYLHVKKMVVAANLDPDTVYKGRPDAFARLLEPEQRKDLFANLNHRGPGENSRFWLTSFAPKTAERVGDVVKVRGTTKVRKASENGLRGVMITLDHNFVYPVHRPGKSGTLIRVVVRRTSEIFVYREGAAVKIWLSSSGASAAPVHCDSEDGFLRPTYDDGSQDGPEPTGVPMDPYDLTVRQAEADDCQAVTRT